MSDPFVAAFRAREYPEAGPSAVHLDSASYGLLPRATIEAVNSLTRRRGVAGAIADAEPGAAFRRARAAAAALLGVPVGEVSLAPNTSYGINLAASVAAAGPPGRIVVSAGEFPANVLPWLPLRAQGFRVDVIPLRDGLPDEAALLEEASRDDVRAVSVSAVQFSTGARVDLGALGRVCREADTLFVVDAIQALGVVPIHPGPLGIDIVATGGQKWLCSPWGSGFVWVSPRCRERAEPPVVSWLAVEGGAGFSARSGYALDWVGDGRRFEPATLGLQDYLGLAVSVEALLDLGVERIGTHVRALHEPVLEWARSRGDVRVVTPEGPGPRAGILALALGDPHGALEALRAAGLRAAVREDLLRLAPHLSVDLPDMERVVDVLDGVVGG